MGSRVLSALCCVALVVLSTAVFGPTIRHQFVVYEDGVHLYENPRITSGEVGSFWQEPYHGRYTPVTYTAWSLLAAADRALHPLNRGELTPGFFHGANVLLHAVNGVLLFCILQLLFSHRLAAFLGAAIFLLHPLQVEPVAWATGFGDLLAAFFGLLAVCGYLSWGKRKEGTSGPTYVLATVAFALALLAKPSAAFVVLACAGVDLLAVRRSWRATARALVPWCLLAMPLLWLAWGELASGVAWTAPSLGQRLYLAGASLAFYVSKTLAPLGLAPEYGLPMVADRHAYGALAAAGALVGAAILRWPGWQTKVAAGAAIALLAILSTWQISKWQDSETLLRYTIAVSPRSESAHRLLADIDFRAERWSPALHGYEKCLALRPESIACSNGVDRTLERLQGEQRARRRAEAPTERDSSR